ncbi:MAG: YceI family protein [Epsilonproteobacteria bacterium]|nr:YceI family protein [Campylobacterota bacterium]
MKLKIVTLLFGVMAWGSMLFGASYTLDTAHTQVGFSVKHLMITNVKGTFSKYSADIGFDSKTMQFERLTATIDVDSIDTGIKKRDKHLRSADFFDVANHPIMTFVMNSYSGDTDGGKMVGDLTIRGVTKAVTLDVEIGGVANFMGTEKVGFVLETKIDRKDFGLMWNKALETGGVVVGDKVKIVIEAEANRQ